MDDDELTRFTILRVDAALSLIAGGVSRLPARFLGFATVTGFELAHDYFILLAASPQLHRTRRAPCRSAEGPAAGVHAAAGLYTPGRTPPDFLRPRVIFGFAIYHWRRLISA